MGYFQIFRISLNFRHICGPLQEALQFMSNDYFRKTAVRWFRQQPKELFSDGTSRVVHQRFICLNVCGDSNRCNTFTINFKSVSVVNTSHLEATN
jgi:hypothetical protein